MSSCQLQVASIICNLTSVLDILVQVMYLQLLKKNFEGGFVSSLLLNISVAYSSNNL